MRYLLRRKKFKRKRAVKNRRGEGQITHCPLTIIEIGSENVVGWAANAGSIVAAGMIGAFNLGDAECLGCADSLPWFIIKLAGLFVVWWLCGKSWNRPNRRLAKLAVVVFWSGGWEWYTEVSGSLRY